MNFPGSWTSCTGSFRAASEAPSFENEAWYPVSSRSTMVISSSSSVAPDPLVKARGSRRSLRNVSNVAGLVEVVADSR